MIEGAGAYVGPAGWSYPDWAGKVYPDPRPPGFDELAFVSSLFNLVEINSTFYRVPAARMTESWVRRTAPRRGFVFAAKAWQGFTHERERASAGDAEAFREGMKPIVEAGRLGALLFQFAWSFEETPANRDHLKRLAEAFAWAPRVVEVRHASWNTEEGIEFLRGEGWSFCNVDQPRSSTSIAGTAHVTGRIGYIRLHGRNREAWFRKGAGRDERYDYLYTRQELDPWVRAAHGMAAEVERVIVVANNHFRGKAVANALQLAADLTGEVPEVPAHLLDAYPALAGLKAASAADDA